MAYRVYRSGDPHAIWVLALAALVSIDNAAENTAGLSMNLSVNDIFGYALCYVILVVVIETSRMTKFSSFLPVVSYFGVLSYPFDLLP